MDIECRAFLGAEIFAQAPCCGFKVTQQRAKRGRRCCARFNPCGDAFQPIQMHGEEAPRAGNSLRPGFQIIQHLTNDPRHRQKPRFMAAQGKGLNARQPDARIRKRAGRWRRRRRGRCGFRDFGIKQSRAAPGAEGENQANDRPCPGTKPGGEAGGNTHQDCGALGVTPPAAFHDARGDEGQANAEQAANQRCLAHGEKIKESRRQQRKPHQGQQPKAPETIHSPNTEATARHSASKPASTMVPPSNMKPSERLIPSGRLGVGGAGRGALRFWLTRRYIAFVPRPIKTGQGGSYAMEQIAIIGSGLIGRAWAMVFARAGHSVRIWDPVAGVPQAALGLIGQSLEDLADAGLITETPAVIAARISAAPSMEDCVAGSAHVQENGPERVEPKRELFARLDALCGPDVVLASSTSGIPASAFTEALAWRARCLVAHPVNPPYLVPLVELVGAPWTAPEVVARTRALMARIGQVPVTALKETRGFVLNRLQAALVAEAFRLVRDGVMSVEDVDACVKDGLGLRWSFMGPFETIDLNAPGGVADYAARFGGLMGGITEEQTPFLYDDATVTRVTAERRAALPLEKIGERSAWRDRRLMGVLGHKKQARE